MGLLEITLGLFLSATFCSWKFKTAFRQVLNLPGEMCERLVCFCHFVSIFSFLYSFTFIFRSCNEFISKLYMHWFALFPSCRKNNPSECQRLPSLRPHLSRYLIDGSLWHSDG